MSQDYLYEGNELSLFRAATNWKQYLADLIIPHIGDTVLEVGAGIGSTTEVLCHDGHSRWLCLEPDETQCEVLQTKIAEGVLPACCEVVHGALNSVDDDTLFDTILYIDVLEHIENDHEEVFAATKRIREGGRLIVVSPAMQFLFSPFDRAIGHFRRYTSSTLRHACEQRALSEVSVRYIDSIGFFASLANAIVIHGAEPSERQILLWDRWLVPLSRYIDPILGRFYGKSILGIWKKSQDGD